MKIKHNKITLLRELLVTQMNHWMLFPVYAMLISLLSDINGTGSPHILLWFALGSIPFVLYLGRFYFKKLWTLMVLHLLVIMFLAIIPAEHISITIFHIFIGIVYVIYSTYLWATTTKKEDSKLYAFLGVGVSVIMLLFLHSQGHTEWDAVFVTVLIVALSLYFIIYYIEQYQNFLTVNNNSAVHIPTEEMFKSGIGLVMGYTGIALFILFFISNINWLRGFLQSFKMLLIYLLNLFFSLFPKNTGTVAEKTQEVMVENTQELMPMLEVDEPFWLWKVIDVVVEIVFIAVIVVLLVKITVFLVKFVKRKLTEVRIDKMKISMDDVLDVREKCDIVSRSEWKVKLPFLRLKPKERIRHLYKKRILASRNAFSVGSDNKSLNCFTARQSSQILARDELAYIYEKARYSNEECDSEDVKHMRDACR